MRVLFAFQTGEGLAAHGVGDGGGESGEPGPHRRLPARRAGVRWYRVQVRSVLAEISRNRRPATGRPIALVVRLASH